MLQIGAKKRKLVCYSQQGVALVSVMLFIMLVMILASSILRMSYVAYERKMVEKKSDNNFYSAEGVVDDVQMALQSSVSMVLSSVSDKNASQFIISAYNYITANGNLTPEYLTKQFFLKLDDDPTDDKPSEKQLAVGTQELLDTYYSGYETRGGDFKISYVSVPTTSDTSFRIGVYVKYVNDTGYVSDISTDIVIHSPMYASTKKNALGTYSMFCGSGADINSVSGDQFQNEHPGYFIQEGNVYIGSQVSPATEYANASLTISDSVTADFPGDNIVINGDIYVGKHSVLRFTGALVEVRGKIHLAEDAYLVIGSDTELVCQDIDAGGKSVKNGEYSNSVYGSGYSEYFPYRTAISDSSYYDGKKLSGLIEDYKNDAVNGSILYLDSTDKKIYSLALNNPSTLPAEGNTIIWKDKNGKNFSGSIYFDSTLEMHAKTATYVYYEVSGETIETIVDDKFAEFVNMDGLVRLERVQGTSSGCMPAGNHSGDGSSAVYTELYQMKGITLDDDATLGQYKVTSLDLNMGKNYGHYQHAFDTDSGVVVKDYYAEGQSLCIGNSTQDSLNPTNALCIWLKTAAFTVRINDSSYLGIFMSANKVVFQVNGKATGYSILDIGATKECQQKNYDLTKQYMDEFGYYLLATPSLINQWNTTNNPYNGFGEAQSMYYRALLTNNVFEGGTSVFYDVSGDANGGNGSNADNNGLEFITPDDWTRE